MRVPSTSRIAAGRVGISFRHTRSLVPNRTNQKSLVWPWGVWEYAPCAGHTYAEPVLGLSGALPVPALGRPLGGVSVFKGPVSSRLGAGSAWTSGAPGRQSSSHTL